MLEECVKRLRTNIVLLVTVLLATYLAYQQREDDRQFLREYALRIAMIKIPEIAASSLHAKFEETDRELTILGVKEGVSAPRILAHWKASSRTTFYESFCSDSYPQIKPQKIAEDIIFRFGPSEQECKKLTSAETVPTFAQKKQLDSCSYIDSDSIYSYLSETFTSKCFESDESLPGWLIDLTLFSDSSIGPLSPELAKQMQCSEKFDDLADFINYRLSEGVGAHLQLAIYVEDKIDDEPHYVWFSDVGYSGMDYDGEVHCGLFNGSVGREPSTPSFPIEESAAHRSAILVLLSGKSTWPGVKDILARGSSTTTEELEKHYRTTLDTYRKQEFRLPGLGVSLSFDYLDFGSIGIGLVMLISSCATLRRLLVQNCVEGNFPWGLLAINEISGLKSLSALIESFWYVCFYALAFVVPLLLVANFLIMSSNTKGGLLWALIGLIIVYSVYGFTLLARILVTLYSRRSNTVSGP